jgi:hypothetical protein
LAVAVGVVSLVQPELLTGEIAIIGKMAGDSAKAKLTKIAQDEGTKVVQAISKDASDDAKQVEEAHDKAEADEKKAKEGAEKVVQDAKTSASTEEKPLVDLAHDGLSAAGATALGTALAANVSPGQTEDQVVTLELDQPDAANPTAHHPITLKITVGADGQVKGVAQTVIDEEPLKATETKTEDIPEVKTGESKTEAAKIEEVKAVDAPKVIDESKVDPPPVQAKEVTSEAPKAIESKIEDSPKSEEATVEVPTSSSEEKPISLNVTIAADGHVESVTQTVVEPTPAPVETSKSNEIKSEESKPQESKSEEVKVEETQKVSGSVAPAPVEPVIETPKPAETSEKLEEVKSEAPKEVVAKPAVSLKSSCHGNSSTRDEFSSFWLPWAFWKD